MSTNQDRTSRIALEEKLEAVYDSSPEKLKELFDSMYSNAQSVYYRAVANADRLGHPVVDNVHLLLGVLALGNEDPSLAVPRTLRRFGLDYLTLNHFLQMRSDLRGPLRTAGLPTPSQGLMQTLNRAHELSERRENVSCGVIITADLVVALVEAEQTDTDLKRAFELMGVAKFQMLVLKDLLDGPEVERQPQRRHLQIVD